MSTARFPRCNEFDVASNPVYIAYCDLMGSAVWLCNDNRVRKCCNIGASVVVIAFLLIGSQVELFV